MARFPQRILMMNLRTQMLLPLLLCPMLLKAEDSYFWAVTRTWPIPIPVTNYSTILPQFFLQNCVLGLPCKRVDDTEVKYNYTDYKLEGTLCFTHNTSARLQPCLLLDTIQGVSFLNPVSGIDQSWAR